MLNKNIFGEVPEVVDNAVRNTLASLEEPTDLGNMGYLKPSKNLRVQKRSTIRISCSWLFSLSVSAR